MSEKIKRQMFTPREDVEKLDRPLYYLLVGDHPDDSSDARVKQAELANEGKDVVICSRFDFDNRGIDEDHYIDLSTSRRGGSRSRVAESDSLKLRLELESKAKDEEIVRLRAEKAESQLELKDKEIARLKALAK